MSDSRDEDVELKEFRRDGNRLLDDNESGDFEDDQGESTSVGLVDNGDDDDDLEGGRGRGRGRDSGSGSSELLRPSFRSAEIDAATKRRVMISVAVGILAVIILGGLVIAMIAATPSTAPPPTSMSWRLPNTTRPENYQMYISIYISENEHRFVGTSNITLILSETTNTIVLNAADLAFQNASIQSLTQPGQIPLPAKNISLNIDREFVYFKFASNLAPGRYSLRIAFTGTVGNDLRGLYRSSYKDDQGLVHWMAVTQFEPSDARRAFPCFDEPAYKATYDITLEGPSSMSILCNTESLSTVSKGKGRKAVVFDTTPPMSSYLIAFVVGDFVPNSVLDSKQRNISIWTVPGKSSQANFARDFTKLALKSMESYFAFQYPFNKLDLVAIPDFSAGAMENWGLITFRETALLVGANPAERDLSAVGGTIAHELVHQWTGDLVTCEWWSTLWLNEGFATFYEPYFVNELYPEWEELDSYMEIQSSGMDEDGLPSSHAIVLPVESPDEGQDVFDGVTYEKGGSVLRMISSYLDQAKGTNTWRNALRIYIKTYNYSNADTPKLWNSIGDTLNMPDLAKQMLPWTNTPGYPVVTFVPADDGKYIAKQQRYFSLKDNSTDESANTQTWWIPLTIQLSDGSIVEAAFDTPESDQIQLTSKSSGWFKANKNQTGFYRVNYPKSIWDQLASKFSKLDRYDRAGLVNDAIHFAYSGELDPVDAFEFLKVLRNQKENAVWSTFWGTFGTFYDIMSDLPCYSSFEAYAKYLLQPTAESLGWHDSKDDSHSVGLLRYNILNAAVRFRAFTSITEPLEKFRCAINASLCDPDVSADARLAAYRAGVMYGGKKEYDAVLDKYQNEVDANERVRLLNALGFATDRGLLINTLQLSLNEAIVRSQDRERVVLAVAQNPLGRELAWWFIQENWQTFNSRGFGVGRLLGVLTHFSGEFYYQQFSDFFTKNPPTGAARTLQAALEVVRANGLWKDNHADHICAWLDSSSF